MQRTGTQGFAIGLAILVLTLAAGAAEKDATPEDPTQIIVDRIIHHSQGWGEMGLDTCTHAPGIKAHPLRIKDQSYAKGLGTHAPGETYIELEGLFARFEAEVGVQWQQHDQGSVIFQVLVDGEKRFDSGVMREHDAPRKVEIDLSGAGELQLVALDAGDGITCDCANWAEARLIPDPSASARLREPQADVAPFARVVTSDPSRMDGARSTRIQAFQAEDVFLSTELLPGADGAYAAPAQEDGLSCIGLEWAERRLIRRVALEFAGGGTRPSVEGARVQFWTGESPWQGNWVEVDAAIETADGLWQARLGPGKDGKAYQGTEKIRWIFSDGSPVRMRRLYAYTNSRVESVRLRLEAEQPAQEPEIHIEMYNGVLLSDDGQDASLACAWDTRQALPLNIRYYAPRGWKTDRTVLRFQYPATGFGVAVEDVLEHGCVYVPHVGLFVTRDPAPMTLADYKREIAGKKTILERVREMPDQSFAQAIEHVHNPIQDKGPMLVSLACDNRKFVVQREGDITFGLYDRPDQEAGWPQDYAWQLTPQFGEGAPDTLSRRLHGEWLPAPITTITHGDLAYRQTTWVAPLADAPDPDTCGWLYTEAVCVAAYAIENTSSEETDVALRLTFASRRKNDVTEVSSKPVDDGVLVTAQGRVLALVETGQGGLKLHAEAASILLTGRLAPGATAACAVCIPAWPVRPEVYGVLKGRADSLHRLEKYWASALENAAVIETPDPLLNNVIRASQVHCLLAARNEEHGRYVSAYISSDRYGPLESEAHSVIRGMDLMGHDDFARRALDFFVKRYNPEGFLTTGYTVMGTGWHLWTLAEYYQRSGNRAWFEAVAPEVARVCRWVAEQRRKTQRLDTHGDKMPEYGLVPPGVAADWNRFAYRFAQEGHYCAGLSQAAEALADIGHPDAPALLEDARAFRAELLRAYRWAQARCPVLPLANGAWTPAYPGMLYGFGRLEDLIPGEDGNRSWAYDVELGAHHLAALGVLDAAAPDTAWMMDHMEDFWFLHSGMGDYPEEQNREDWFSRGGWAKVQPYYARNAEICALRDDVKPFIRSYFNTIPTLLSLENLSFWEHFHNTGGWNKTHETGYFLAQSRLLLVMERGDELWLAPFLPEAWLEEGKRVAVRNVPTRFGRVSFEVASHINTGILEASIDPPDRTAPSHIVLRLRAPGAPAIENVEVTGAREYAIDNAQRCVRIVPNAAPIHLRVAY